MSTPYLCQPLKKSNSAHMDTYVYLVPAMGLIGLLYTFYKFAWVSRQEAGTDRMKEISNYIAEGAMAFLRAEWKILTYFVIIVGLLLGYMGSRSDASHWSIALAFVLGAFFSALARSEERRVG